MVESQTIDIVKLHIEPFVHVNDGYVLQIIKMVEMGNDPPYIRGHPIENLDRHRGHKVVLRITLGPSLMSIYLIELSWLVTTSLSGLDIMA